MSDLLNTNRFEPLANLYVLIKPYYIRCITSKNDKYSLTSEHLIKVFNDIANDVSETAMSVLVKSMPQEVHGMFSDPDLDPLKADELLKERFNVLKQQLQHSLCLRRI